MTSHRVIPIVVAITVALLAAFAGGALTDVGPWYAGLAKPPWNPPNWLFGPAWTLIYVALVVAGVQGWTSVRQAGGRGLFLGLIAINLALNVAWSFLFFFLKRPDFALLEVVFLWLSILAIFLFLASKNRSASLLVIPYLVWVGFAGFLNLVIVRMNPSFGLF